MPPDPRTPTSPTTPKERFFRYFQHEVTALQEQMGRLGDIPLHGGERNDAIDHCLAGISRLSHEVKDASVYIPSYDQRTYAEAIKALSEKLQNTRAALAPKPKFTFKTVHKNASAISIADAAELASQQRPQIPAYSVSSSTSVSAAPTPDRTRSPFTGSDSVVISNRMGSHVVLPSSASQATAAGSLGDLRTCIVDMSVPTSQGKPFASLTLKNVTDSLVVCGQVSGPVHMTNLRNCIVVAACRQLRMHECKNVDLYLHCVSRPIIEDCTEVRFAPIPAFYSLNDGLQGHNQWDQVDDFKWLKSEHSPHWSVLPSNQRLKEHIWADLVPGGTGLDIKEILKAVNILDA